jgi:hypothetical protein
MRHSGTVTSDPDTLTRALAAYARRLHAAFGPEHHVGSPLGAWLLLALCGPAAGGGERAELTEVLGCDIETAARLADQLLSSPHPLVAAAAALWQQPGAVPEDWRAGLPAAVTTGPLPSQAELDAWARDHTFGLIDRFPLLAGPADLLTLATAVATRVSWRTPFDRVPAAELGLGSAWAGQLSWVLQTPELRHGAAPGHREFIAITPEAGDVIVHLAWATGGLLVASVAAAENVSYLDVLAVAQRIAVASARAGYNRPDVPGVPRRELADLPLGEAPLWRLREEQSLEGDQVTAVLPAWSARSQLDLSDPSLGFGAAAAALDPVDPWRAAQSTVARYSRTGFEAAAVSAIAVALAMRRPAVHRVAELRFAHPYAAVAVVADAESPWHGVPVFSAWVADPEDPDEEADAR